MDAADGRLVAGVVEWLFGEVLLDVGLKPADQKSSSTRPVIRRPVAEIIIIIMVIFKCYFSGEHISLSITKNNNGVNIALGKTNRLKALCMMQINT